MAAFNPARVRVGGAEVYVFDQNILRKNGYGSCAGKTYEKIKGLITASLDMGISWKLYQSEKSPRYRDEIITG